MKRFSGLALLLLFGLLISLGRAPEAQAGMYNADAEVTYKEYWIPHTEFTGGCDEDGNDLKPNGVWYSEPDKLDECPKEMQFDIPDNITNALRAEVYVDLWRNYDEPSARLRINNSPTVLQAPRGYDWSRTPWIQEIPLSMLVSGGTNYFLFWAEGSRYHIHDVGIRVYYDAAHPIIGNGANLDVEPPTGQLTKIVSDNQVETLPDAGGNLFVNNNKLTLTADVVGAKFVEFHAYYDGYDDDNDGETRDWHSVNRNNWWPGGKPEAGSQPYVVGNGTLNHIGTVETKTLLPKTVSIIWDIKHIANQAGVRFKLRLIDDNGNVREGSITPDFSFVRNYPVLTYTIPNFDDFGLHMDGVRPDVVTYDFPLPANLDMSKFSKAYLVGMYWRRPDFSLNGSPRTSIRDGGDDWALGIKEITKSFVKSGNNQLSFYWKSGIGQFIEHPGPMIVLLGNNPGVLDIADPYLISNSPTDNSTDVDIFAPITIRLGDGGTGVNVDSIILSVDSQLINLNDDEVKVSGPSNDLTITYTPSTPYPTLTNIPVTVYACDLLQNCMDSAAVFDFTIEAPDTTDPIISNINAETTNTEATISWTTNEATDGLVEYGLTTGYEKPDAGDSQLLTFHSFKLTGLQADTTYNFRLSSTDYSHNTTTTLNQTFHTKKAPGDIISSDFSGCVLDTSVWSFINPANDATLTMTGAEAKIGIPAGAAHDNWRQGLLAPRLMQYVTNQNFDVEVKFTTPTTKKTQSQGILVQQDPSNWLRFNFQNDGSGVNSLVVARSNKNVANASVIFSTPVATTAPSYMRLNRVGDLWNVQYSVDGSTWIFATTITQTLTMSQIGPYAANTGTNPEHTGSIDYFENMNAPFNDTDPAIALDLTVEGVGDVNLNPPGPTYQCNETVTLTAVPATDWVFVGWEGAIASTNLTESITLTRTESVTARFTNDNLYTVNVNVVNQGNGVGGTVTKEPDQGNYLYGTPIKLTATPTQGWSFLGWSGDFESADPVTTMPVTGNMDVTATFDQDEYTVETLVIAEGVGQGGTVTVAPAGKTTWLYGEPITLTVTPEPGWSFIGWEGEGVSGTNEVIAFPMTQNVVAIAHLVQNQYDVAIDIESLGEGEGGVVLKDPDQPAYGYGQTLTMTAAPELGWLFTGWSGDLIGTTPTQTVTITDDLAATATFTQEEYTITVTTQGPGAVTLTPNKPFYRYGEVVTLTPVAQQGYEFALWSGDYTGMAEPAFLAVTQDYVIEALFVVDNTPIEIIAHDIEILPGGTLARVTWTTDVPGTSRVDYGETTFYEVGTVTEDDLVTEHEVVLTGLTPETFYHYQIISVDQFDNEVESADLTFSTSSSSGIFSDDFSMCTLSDRWTWIDPEGDSTNAVSGQQVEISVPAESIHNVWSDMYNVPRLMQPSNDTDFTIEVKFDSMLTGGGTGQGLIIEQDDQNFLRFDFFVRTFNAPQPPEMVIYAATFENLTPVVRKNTKVTTFSAPMWMRVVRTGNEWEQWYSFDGENWTKNVTFTFDTTVKRVGIFAANPYYRGEVPAHTAVVDYFFNTASPITPEDAAYELTFEVEGSGSIEADPERKGYYCGEEVTLTAVGSPGWGFVAWDGDISGNNPTRTINVTDDMTILARFQQGAATYRLLLPMLVDRP